MSLLEVMLAFLLVSLAAVAIMAVYTGGLKLSARGERLVVATEQAQAFLESLKEFEYQKLPSAVSSFDGRRGEAADAEGFPPEPYPGTPDFPIVVKCFEKEPDLKSVTVRVFYDEEHCVVLQTYITPFQ